jgi:mannose-6-phosphate isomerase-like protein (cupin superfamily)
VSHASRNTSSRRSAPREYNRARKRLAIGYVSVRKVADARFEHAEFRPVLKGQLATSESLEVHETTLQPGGAPHPPHHHVHSEMWLIREGTVEITVSGTSYLLGPGSVGFVHSNDEHGIKNVGTTPATYFVVAIGPGAGA